MTTILFACVHNAGRSQIAAALFDLLADSEKAKAISAGSVPGDRVHSEVMDVMREVGVDLSNAKPQRLTAELARSAGMLITMGCGQACPVVPGVLREDWVIEDPKGKPLSSVRKIRDEIHARVFDLVQRHGWSRSQKDGSSEVGGKKTAGVRNKEAVLFLCTGNAARSQMAEALLRRRAGDQFAVYSAGLAPTQVHPLTHEVLQEISINTSTLHSKSIHRFLGKLAVNVAIIVCEKAAESCPRLYPFALHVLYWPFEDPVAFEGTPYQQLEKFREVRDAIDLRVQSWLASRDTKSLKDS